MLKLKNTKTKHLDAIDTDSHIKIYTCGPTVYDYAHIGNFRTFLWEDVLIRVLKFACHSDLNRVMNFTDVDDKTIAKSIETCIPLKQYTEKYIDAFLCDCKDLNMLPADLYPKATDYIPEMISMISTLIDNNNAYEKDGSVYFEIKSDKNYGRLANVCCDNSTDITDDDESFSGDFVLWKAWNKVRDGSVFWDSPWGKGRPGWHIECSAMILKEFGETIDIHAGGVDNIFPHHENEAAQTENVTNKPFVKTWMHVAHLTVNNLKMSKSLGNFYTVRELINEGFSGEEVRFALLAGHYTKEINFTKQSLEHARATFSFIKETCNRALFCKKSINASKDSGIEKYINMFTAHVYNNLNVAGALKEFFDLLNYINKRIDVEDLSKQQFKSFSYALQKMGEILGFDFSRYVIQEIPEHILSLAKKRNIERNNKNWGQSDLLRQEIYNLGFDIIDEKHSYRIIKRYKQKS